MCICLRISDAETTTTYTNRQTTVLQWSLYSMRRILTLFVDSWLATKFRCCAMKLNVSKLCSGSSCSSFLILSIRFVWSSMWFAAITDSYSSTHSTFQLWDYEINRSGSRGTSHQKSRWKSTVTINEILYFFQLILKFQLLVLLPHITTLYQTAGVKSLLFTSYDKLPTKK